MLSFCSVPLSDLLYWAFGFQTFFPFLPLPLVSFSLLLVLVPPVVLLVCERRISFLIPSATVEKEGCLQCKRNLNSGVQNSEQKITSFVVSFPTEFVNSVRNCAFTMKFCLFNCFNFCDETCKERLSLMKSLNSATRAHPECLLTSDFVISAFNRYLEKHE
jgi:hypothetical protein